MNLLQALWLGIIQGLTEFLPVSSSGHLALAQKWLGLDAREELFFTLVLHMGSLVAVVFYFRRELIRLTGRVLFFLLLATAVTGVLGLLFQSFFESAFSKSKEIGVEFFLTAGLLLVAQGCLRRRGEPVPMNWLHAVVIGLFQAISLLPAISRSGATLTGGLLCRLDREEAFRFAFLLSIPAIALVFAVKGLQESATVWQPELFPSYAFGFVASMVTSYLALNILHWFLLRRQLLPFALYCFGIGILTLFVF